jgi:hypothetical protein
MRTKYREGGNKSAAVSVPVDEKKSFKYLRYRITKYIMNMDLK